MVIKGQKPEELYITRATGDDSHRGEGGIPRAMAGVGALLLPDNYQSACQVNDHFSGRANDKIMDRGRTNILRKEIGTSRGSGPKGSNARKKAVNPGTFMCGQDT